MRLFSRCKVVHSSALLAATLSAVAAVGLACLLPNGQLFAKPAPQADRQALSREQSSLKGQISSIKKDIGAKEARLNEVNAELQKSEQAISNSNRTLRNLAADRSKIEAQLADLKNEAKLVGRDVKEAEKDIEQISKAQFVNARRHPWQSVLVGNNPNDIKRMSGILSYLEREQARTVDLLENRQKRIAENTRKTTEKRTELARVEADEQKNREQLRQEQKQRETARLNLTKALDSQRERYEQLVKNDKQLSSLIANIDKQIAEAAKKEAARQLALQKKAEEERRKKKPGSRPAPVVIASPSTNFTKLRGKLTMPTRGTIAARFGQKRQGAASTLPWRGILIRANQGTNVVAAAAGTVVFSDWMRGFGNLLIVDHGSNYLSVYANNESLYKSVGDKVKQGETIASVGNSGGEDKPGLYFELRRKGTPIDPTPWLARK